ncbi:hypothetical protein EVAR_94376_1 [Eumeta japonica]|uniref:Uncharacterized protein n=1 Tax=Eumeta variegata TaxID=151549 RepID=A0A4C1TQ04_EUMVA|nr:hypothetical protein EVAR_94376_1 [Eumeta japonica]
MLSRLELVTFCFEDNANNHRAITASPSSCPPETRDSHSRPLSVADGSAGPYLATSMLIPFDRRDHQPVHTVSVSMAPDKRVRIIFVSRGEVASAIAINARLIFKTFSNSVVSKFVTSRIRSARTRMQRRGPIRKLHKRRLDPDTGALQAAPPDALHCRA